MKYQKARQRAESALLDVNSIRKIVRSIFRRRNDYSLASIEELPAELRKFGITTNKDLRLLMKKHRRSLLIDENIQMSRAETLWLCHEEGFGGIDTLAGISWYAIPGLVRQAMELEFGEEAVVYASELQV